MGAVHGSQASDATRRLGEFYGNAHLLYFAVPGVIDLNHHSPVEHLRIRERLIQIIDRRNADILILQEFKPFVSRSGEEDACKL